MLDTTDGTVTRQLNATASFKPTYVEGDPRQWRDECTDDTFPVAKYFDELKGYYLRLEWVPFWRRGEVKLLRPNSGEHQQISAIYRYCGWPNNFRRDECAQA